MHRSATLHFFCIFGHFKGWKVEERKKALAEQAEERKKALEARRAIMAEKNRLAEENERIRKEREAEKRLRSDKAIEHLIESRKRRR